MMRNTIGGTRYDRNFIMYKYKNPGEVQNMSKVNLTMTFGEELVNEYMEMMGVESVQELATFLKTTIKLSLLKEGVNELDEDIMSVKVEVVD